jgi:hypothetical protein
VNSQEQSWRIPSGQKLPGTFCHQNALSSDLSHHFSIIGGEEVIGALFA